MAANREQRGRYPSLARGFASTSIKYGYVKRSGAPQGKGQVTLTKNFPDRTVWWGTQTISSLICENKCGFVEPLSYVPLVAKMSQPPIENMVWTNSHAHAQNSVNLHNTLYPP